MPPLVEFYELADPLAGKVSYGADGVDEAMLDRAEKVMIDLQPNFAIWIRNDLERLETHFELAASVPVDERTLAMHDLFVAAYDIKGQGGCFGRADITDIAYELCRFIESLDRLADDDLEIVGHHIHVLRRIILRG